MRKSTDFCGKVHGLLRKSPRNSMEKSTDFDGKVHGLLRKTPRTSAEKSTDFCGKVHGENKNKAPRRTMMTPPIEGAVDTFE